MNTNYYKMVAGCDDLIDDWKTYKSVITRKKLQGFSEERIQFLESLKDKYSYRYDTAKTDEWYRNMNDYNTYINASKIRRESIDQFISSKSNEYCKQYLNEQYDLDELLSLINRYVEYYQSNECFVRGEVPEITPQNVVSYVIYEYEEAI